MSCNITTLNALHQCRLTVTKWEREREREREREISQNKRIWGIKTNSIHELYSIFHTISLAIVIESYWCIFGPKKTSIYRKVFTDTRYDILNRKSTLENRNYLPITGKHLTKRELYSLIIICHHFLFLTWPHPHCRSIHYVKKYFFWIET